jgi:hypothetical protein
VKEATPIAHMVEIINIWEILDNMTDGKRELYWVGRGQYEIES